MGGNNALLDVECAKLTTGGADDASLVALYTGLSPEVPRYSSLLNAYLGVVRRAPSVRDSVVRHCDGCGCRVEVVVGRWLAACGTNFLRVRRRNFRVDCE